MLVYHCFPEGKFKALTMSYDDGVLADKRLVSIFNQYGMKGTFNLNYGLMDRSTKVPKEEVASLYEGHEVATHTAHHPTIARCPFSYVAEEIMRDREGLESIVGYVVRGHAYPNGSYSKEIEELLQSLGIAYARTTNSSHKYNLPENPLEWHPTCHHNDPRLMEHAKFVAETTKWQYLRLLYVWGHSYEFDNNDNWNVIEEFCQYMGGRSDIWYATNIEIVNYMQVLKNLQFTARCDGVFNPSAQSAWLNVQVSDDSYEIIEAKGGCFTSFMK